jgi:hypothetical protein
MTVRRLSLGVAAGFVAAAVVSAVAFAAAPAPKPGPAKANPCAEVKNCKVTEGPWVAVPATGEADFLLECPKRSGTIGGTDALTDTPDVRVTWEGNTGSPVRPGTTTVFFAFFRAISAKGKAGLFQPYIGCIPQQKVKPRATVSARVAHAAVFLVAARSAAVTHPGAFLDRRQTLFSLKSGASQTASQACGKHERLLSGWYAVVFGTTTVPKAGSSLASKVHATISTTSGKVVASVQTDAGIPAAARAELQVGALCAS